MSGSTQTGQAPAASHFSGSANDRPTRELYATCIHCGLCLNHCPTYRVLGTEMDSPRGRIFQILSVDEGRLAIAEPFVTHIDRCLGCLACETACPSGVHYGQIVERARAQIESNFRRSWLERTLRSFFFRRVLADYALLARLARFLRLYQRSGMQRLVRVTRIARLFGSRMEKVERLSPAIDAKFYFTEFGKTFPAVGERRARVAFHAGCIASVSFSELNRATVQLLTANGVEVVVPAEQRCCGALQSHAGFREEARKQARANIDEILSGEFDAIVTNAAGCGSTLKEYDDLLREDSLYAGRAQQFRDKVRDVTEFLAELGLRAPQRSYGAAVTYQDPCHLAHAQKVRQAPRELLSQVGAQIIEMPHSDQCCGSAGTYNVVQNELSMKILDRKMDDLTSVGADIQAIVTANVGCMLQLQAGAAQRGLKLPVLHVIEVLAQCY